MRLVPLLLPLMMQVPGTELLLLLLLLALLLLHLLLALAELLFLAVVQTGLLQLLLALLQLPLMALTLLCRPYPRCVGSLFSFNTPLPLPCCPVVCGFLAAVLQRSCRLLVPCAVLRPSTSSLFLYSSAASKISIMVWFSGTSIHHFWPSLA